MARLICVKCRTPITKNKLYRVSKRTRTLRPGQYILKTPNSWQKKYFGQKVFITHPHNILDQDQLTFIPGHGCCGNSGEFFCLCGVHLGEQRLDCYEDNTIRIKFNKLVSIQY